MAVDKYPHTSTDFQTAIFGDHISSHEVQILITEANTLRDNHPLYYQYFRYAPGISWSLVRQYIREVSRASSSRSSNVPAICHPENVALVLGLRPNATDRERADSLSRIYDDILKEDLFDTFHTPHPVFHI